MGVNECYENLANAIILQAVKDYKSNSKECERFFRSEWFKVLTNVDPDYIIKLCHSDIKISSIK